MIIASFTNIIGISLFIGFILALGYTLYPIIMVYLYKNCGKTTQKEKALINRKDALYQYRQDSIKYQSTTKENDENISETD